MEYTKLERAVLDWMSEHVAIPNLRDQIQAAVPTGREYTGHGFFTTMSVPSEISAVHCKSPIDGPVIDAKGIEDGGAAIVFLDDTGHLATLEMYANGDRFAETVTDFELKPWEESNQASDATSEPAPGADSSSHQG